MQELTEHTDLNDEKSYGSLEVDDLLDDLFPGVSDEIPTGDGLSKKKARELLINEMNALIHLHNLKRLRHKQRYIAAPFKPNQIQQAVFMARQQGGYDALLKNAGW